MHFVQRVVSVTLLCSTSLGAASAVSGQKPALGPRPVAVSATGFARIAGVREFADKRVMLVDSDEPSVVMLDSSLTSTKLVGRIGRGPGEYQVPVALFALTAETTAVLDWSGSRLLTFSPSGSPGASLEARWHRSCPNRPGVRLLDVHAIDVKRNFYAEGVPIAQGRGTAARMTDSIAVERWSDTCARDTVVLLPNPDAKTGRLVNGLVIRAGAWEPFPFRTQWTVAPDGSVVVVSAHPYVVTIVDPESTVRRGPVLEYPKRAVSEATKAALRSSYDQPKAVRVGTRDGRTSITRMKVPFPEPQWPPYLPPFVEPIHVDPNGMIWITRAINVGEVPQVDIVDRSGRRVSVIDLPPRSRIVGFGNGVVYLARTDADELEHLQRYILR